MKHSLKWSKKVLQENRTIKSLCLTQLVEPVVVALSYKLEAKEEEQMSNRTAVADTSVPSIGSKFCTTGIYQIKNISKFSLS